MSTKDSPSPSALSIVIILMAWPVNFVLRAFVTAKLWLWFIVPLVVPLGVRGVSTMEMLGVIFLIGFMRSADKPTSTEIDWADAINKALLRSIATPIAYLIVLGFGYLLRFNIMGAP